MHSVMKSFGKIYHSLIFKNRCICLTNVVSPKCFSGFIAFMGFILLLGSCQSDEPVSPGLSFIDVENAFVESNKYLIKLEEEAIDDFIERFGWEMSKTGSGLRYKVHNEGFGKRAYYGDRAVINYEMFLITGDPVYSSDIKGPRSFVVGRGGVERGLEEGILLLKQGASATFIMPHYLAYGVPGDKNKIPKRATIIYKVELINLQ